MHDVRLLDAANELVTDALKAGNVILRLRDESGAFVKAKRAYMDLSDMRNTYLEALNFLHNEGKVQLILTNDELEVFEITAKGRAAKHSVEQAKQLLLHEMRQTGHAFKIHSLQGEFVQCGQWSHNTTEEERILYLSAFCELLSHGAIQVVWESREISRYEFAPAPGVTKDD